MAGQEIAGFATQVLAVPLKGHNLAGHTAQILAVPPKGQSIAGTVVQLIVAPPWGQTANIGFAVQHVTAPPEGISATGLGIKHATLPDYGTNLPGFAVRLVSVPMIHASRVSSQIGEALVSSAAGQHVGALMGEHLVDGPIGTRLPSFVGETLVAPFSEGTSIRSIVGEVLVTNQVEEPESDIGVLMLKVLNEVVTSDDYLALTADFNPEAGLTGWIYDKRRLESVNDLSTKHNTYLGGHSVGLRDGTALRDWVSGSVTKLDWLGYDLSSADVNRWLPVVRPGEWSLYWDSRSLFSDKSVCARFDVDNLESGLMVMQLDPEVRPESVQVALWKRTRLFSIMQLWKYQGVDEFTGELSGGARLPTVDGLGALIPANIADRKREWILDDTGKLLLNSDKSIEVGWTNIVDLNDVVVSTVKDLWEHKGQAADGRVLYLNYFPVSQGKIRVAALSAGVWTEYTEKADLYASGPTDLHFSVDYDLGMVQCPGLKGDKVFLNGAVSDTADSIRVHGSTANHMSQGVLTIGAEKIYYSEKTETGFSQLIRGFDGTTAVPQPDGAAITDTRHGLPMTGQVYVSYVAVPRVDYEVSSGGVRHANTDTAEMNLMPLDHSINRGVFQIKGTERNLQQIILSTDLTHMGGLNYGHLSFGTDSARLTALALDAGGNPVEDLPLWFRITYGPGALNSQGARFDTVTNNIGEAYSFYNSPYNRKDIEIHPSSQSYSGGDTKFFLPGLEDVQSMNDIWIFEIMKHDETFGTQGLSVPILDADPTTLPWGDAVVTVDAQLGEDYEDAEFSVVVSGIRRFGKVLQVRNVIDSNSMPVTELYVQIAGTPSAFIGQTATLVRKDAIKWVPALLNGQRRILYEWDSGSEHPLTGAPGAYAPLHPTSVAGKEVTVAGRHLAMPDPEDPTTNLGGYVFYSPRIARVQAFARDPITARIVSSNMLQLHVRLPDSMIGVKRDAPLPIPIGWNLIVDSHNVGTALGGANFITINPQAESINQLCLMGIF